MYLEENQQILFVEWVFLKNELNRFGINILRLYVEKCVWARGI